MHISPNIGLDTIRFGMKRDDVQAILGPPEERTAYKLDDYSTEAWYYWSQGISLNFDEELDWRLTTIEVDSPDAELIGHRPIGMNRQALRTLLEGLTVEWTDDEMEPIRVAEWEMDIYFEDGVLGQVQWSVPLDADDSEVWPD